MVLQERTAVIYGGGGAIGGAVAKVFAREGARVVVAGRTLDRLERVAQEIRAAGGCVETARLDVLDERAVDAHATAVAARFGSIDVAVSAVSFMHAQGPLLPQLSLDEFMRPIDRFLRALFITTRAVAPHMGRRREGVILTLPTLADVAETAAFLASGRARALTATVANLTCGALVD